MKKPITLEMNRREARSLAAILLHAVEWGRGNEGEALYWRLTIHHPGIDGGDRPSQKLAQAIRTAADWWIKK